MSGKLVAKRRGGDLYEGGSTLPNRQVFELGNPEFGDDDVHVSAQRRDQIDFGHNPRQRAALGRRFPPQS